MVADGVVQKMIKGMHLNVRLNGSSLLGGRKGRRSKSGS